MSGIDIILIAGIGAAVVAAVIYIVRAKKKGKACIGCSSSSSCGKANCDCDKS